MSMPTRALIALFIVTAVALPGCRSPEPPPQEVTRVVAQVVELTPAPPPPVQPQLKQLVICMAQEPPGVYVYGETMLTAQAIRHAVYTNYITNLSYDYQADGLEKIPSLADGDALLNVVAVSAGDVVRRADDSVGPLAVGNAIVAADGRTVTFDGPSIDVNQMVVNFTMRPTVWSDGTPVSAADSVYSFNLAADPATTAPKYVIERTAAYEATGELTTRWTGLPGFTDSTYFLNFWQPLPEHLWGEFSAAELMVAEESNRRPVGDGPFVIQQWTPGESIRLTRNPYYYRAGEGLPALDRVTIRFIPDTDQLLAQLLSGQCDIGTQDGLNAGTAPALLEAEASGLLIPYFQTGTTFQHLDFNVNPFGEAAERRYDWFEDARVRQAMMLCTDRPSMVDDILYGRSEVIHTYVPTVHPLYPAEGITEWPYDPAAGNALLDEAGYDQRDADGFRLDPDGARLAPTLGTTAGNALRLRVSQMFRDNMAACGIDVELYYLPAGEWFAGGPEGVLFGRRYDLGLFAWLTGVQPPCDLYLGSRVPGPLGETFEATGVPYTGWGGDNQNNTGWANAAYDAVCQAALGSLPGTPAYEPSHMAAQRIFSEELPVLPLFLSLKVSATRPDVLNFSLDPTQNSELYNIYEYDLAR
jgi:peptide/nickel transport system substrate-binding protein